MRKNRAGTDSRKTFEKEIFMLKKFIVRVGSISAASVSAIASAQAAAPATVADLASSVSFTDVGAAILSVSGTVITLYVIWKGSKFVIRAVKGA